MEQTECSETSAYKTQTLGNYPVTLLPKWLRLFSSQTFPYEYPNITET